MGKNGFRLPFNVFLCQASLSGQLVHGDFGIFLDQGKVVVLLGSPRKTGNSSILSKEIAAGAESVGVVVESLFIKQMDINACQACWSCQKPDRNSCVINDDMEKNEAILKAARKQGKNLPANQSMIESMVMIITAH